MNEKAYDTISKLRSHIYEISNSTLHSYIQKASVDKPKQFNNQLSAGTKATQEWNKFKDTGAVEHKNEFEKQNSLQQKSLNKMQNRTKGIGLAHDKIVGAGMPKPKVKVFGTESVEDNSETIDEISKDLAANYYQSAKSDRNKRAAEQSKSNVSDEKIDKRTKGMGSAIKKIAKPEPEKNSTPKFGFGVKGLNSKKW